MHIVVLFIISIYSVVCQTPAEFIFQPTSFSCTPSELCGQFRGSAFRFLNVTSRIRGISQRAAVCGIHPDTLDLENCLTTRFPLTLSSFQIYIGNGDYEHRIGSILASKDQLGPDYLFKNQVPNWVGRGDPHTRVTVKVGFNLTIGSRCTLDEIRTSKIRFADRIHNTDILELDPNDEHSWAVLSCNTDNGYVDDPDASSCNDDTKASNCIMRCKYDSLSSTIQLTREDYDRIRCVEQNCSDFIEQNPIQIEYVERGKRVNSTVMCICKREFEYNQSEATCRFNATAKRSDWTTECDSLYCLPLKCNSTSAEDSTGKVGVTPSTIQQFGLNETITCMCGGAYKVRSMNLTCSNLNGSNHAAIWKDDSGKENVRCDELYCELKKCDKPAVVSTEHIINYTRPVELNGTLECVCDTDRFIKNRANLTCRWDGNHTNPPEFDTCDLSCTEHSCRISEIGIENKNLEVMNTTTNKKIKAMTISLGEEVTLACSEGFKPVGKVHTSQCILDSVLKEAIWSMPNEFTDCIIDTTTAHSMSSTSSESTKSESVSASSETTTAVAGPVAQEEKSAFREFLDNKEIRRAMMIICAVQSIIISVLMHVAGHLLF